jgi:hypothetical protein
MYLRIICLIFVTFVACGAAANGRQGSSALPARNSAFKTKKRATEVIAAATATYAQGKKPAIASSSPSVHKIGISTAAIKKNPVMLGPLNLERAMSFVGVSLLIYGAIFYHGQFALWLCCNSEEKISTSALEFSQAAGIFAMTIGTASFALAKYHKDSLPLLAKINALGYLGFVVHFLKRYALGKFYTDGLPFRGEYPSLIICALFAAVLGYLGLNN